MSEVVRAPVWESHETSNNKKSDVSLMFFTPLQTSMAAGVSFCQISPVLQCEGGSTWFNMA